MKVSTEKQKYLFIFTDLILFAASYLTSFFITDSFGSSELVVRNFLQTLPAVLIVKYAVFHFFGIFKDITSYFSVHQLQAILKGTIISSVLIFSMSAFYQGMGGVKAFPPYLFFVDFLCLSFLLCARRLIPLTFFGKSNFFKDKELNRVVIVGAGEAGELVVHEIMKSRRMPYLPVCFLDDDPFKIGKRVHGIPVVGSVNDISQIVEEKQIDEILIAIASASGEVIRRIVELSKKAKVPIKTIPSLADLINGKARVEEIRSVNTNDLLRRKPIRIESTKVREYLDGKTILITGAGGSIGSELSRQVARFNPAKLFVLDHSEVNLFTILQELERVYPELDAVPLLANITDKEKMCDILTTLKPEVIFHTAAYKHVGLLQSFPQEAFQNNVLGTKYLSELAAECGVKRFVLVSTDKAVDPVCIMGYTKKIAESYAQAIALNNTSNTKFITVRFGNVLGSAGSVVTIFEEQIKRKENLTVTHPEAERYFMTIAEAVQLIMQAGVMGDGGEVFLLKMGEPVKILDLAKNMITLSGLNVDDDIKISYTGLKQGEKLSEVLVGSSEIDLPTPHDEITIVKNSVSPDFPVLKHSIEKLEREYRLMDLETCAAQIAVLAKNHKILT